MASANDMGRRLLGVLLLVAVAYALYSLVASLTIGKARPGTYELRSGNLVYEARFPDEPVREEFGDGAYAWTSFTAEDGPAVYLVLVGVANPPLTPKELAIFSDREAVLAEFRGGLIPEAPDAATSVARGTIAGLSGWVLDAADDGRRVRMAIGANANRAVYVVYGDSPDEFSGDRWRRFAGSARER